MKMNISEQIAALRKERGLTQEELANILGVTNQAVSKWEAGKCCPDIELLPAIADIFQCSIDALFQRETSDAPSAISCTSFPWKDDGEIRGVVCRGHKILSIEDSIISEFTFVYTGDAVDVSSHCNLSVTGNVQGDCGANGSLTVGGKIEGDCSANGSVTVDGDVEGDCSANGSVTVGGDVEGDCSVNGSATVNGNVDGDCVAGDINMHGNITVGGDIVAKGDVHCESISARGNVTADTITGTVTCASLECDRVNGDVYMK